MTAAYGTPTLSIGMPVYNGAKYLEYTLECLRKQELEDVEVLISDNASTDETPEIAREAAAQDPRITFVRQPENLGPAENFNYVFRHTRGEFFTWLASDDVFDPRYHRRMVEHLQARPEAAAAMARVRLIDHHNNPMDFADEVPNDGDHPDPIERFIRYAEFSHWCQYTYGVSRRSAMAKTRLLLPFWSSDRLWCAELALEGQLLRDPENLFFVRQHPERLTRRMGRREKVTTSFYLTPSGSRAVALYYAKQLRGSIERSDLPEAEKARGRRALRNWALRNSPKLVRSAGRATLETMSRPFTGSKR
jgi:glycosyltransferase involved in cell wall biosynthesis